MRTILLCFDQVLTLSLRNAAGHEMSLKLELTDGTFTDGRVWDGRDEQGI